MSNYLVQTLPKTACPKCGNSEYGIIEILKTKYYTNNYGEVYRSDEDPEPEYIGKCLTCGAQYKMVQAYDTFIPLTKLRSLLIDYQPEVLAKTNSALIYQMKEMPLFNPMELFKNALSKDIDSNNNSEE